MQNDIDIFGGIKRDIQKNPENFKPAGQWLDDFCQNIVSQEEQYIKKLPQTESNTLREIDKKKNLLKKIHKEKKTLTGKIAPYTHNDKKYKKEKKQLAELFCEANQLTLEINKLARELEHIKVKSQEKPGFIQLMSKAFTKAACEYPPNSRKIMLIARLLTDKYLSESKLGITKYEQYVFHHEVREPEGNGPQRLVSEQEMAKDAVLYAEPEAMEIVRDAWAHFQENEKPAETKPEAKPNKPDENKAYIKTGDVWEIGFEGQRIPFRPLKGFRVIAFLLSNPYNEFTAFEVEQGIIDFIVKQRGAKKGYGDTSALHLTDTGNTSKQINEVVLDKVGRADIDRTIQHLEQKISATYKKSEKQYYEEEKQILEGYLKNTKRPDGKTKTFGNPIDSARKRVSGNTQKALDILHRDFPALHKHLKSSLKAKNVCYYKPYPQINWNIS